jgi:hypothetical protein
MRAEGAQPLLEALAAKKGAIVREWLMRTLQTYPEHTGRFLSQERDPFRNPVGSTLKDALPVLFEGVLGGKDTAQVTPALDSVVRIRAVQDFTPGQAVAFVFLLRPVIRDALSTERQEASDRDALAALESRIDALALLAFDLFMKCRERIYEIRTNEARRRIFLLERRHRLDPFTDPSGSEAPAEPHPRGNGLT